MKDSEKYVKQLTDKLTKPQVKALETVSEAFKMAIELKEDFGMFIMVVGHKDMISERPVSYISNLKDDECHLMMLEYAVKRLKKKLGKKD